MTGVKPYAFKGKNQQSIIDLYKKQETLMNHINKGHTCHLYFLDLSPFLDLSMQSFFSGEEVFAYVRSQESPYKVLETTNIVNGGPSKTGM